MDSRRRFLVYHEEATSYYYKPFDYKVALEDCLNVYGPRTRYAKLAVIFNVIIYKYNGGVMHKLLIKIKVFFILRNGFGSLDDWYPTYRESVVGLSSFAEKSDRRAFCDPCR